MTIQMICGSRNHNGQTAMAAKEFLKGAAKAKGKDESLFIPDLSLERCRQCNNDGYGACLDGRCVINDDFGMIFNKIKTSDAILFASPVYFGEPSDSMQALFARLSRICFGNGNVIEVKDKPAVGICVAGDKGFGANECCARLEKFLQICGFYIVDIIPLRRQNLEAKLPSLSIAGEWLATNIERMQQ